MKNTYFNPFNDDTLLNETIHTDFIYPVDEEQPVDSELLDILPNEAIYSLINDKVMSYSK